MNRFKLAWHVLLGRPLMYKINVDLKKDSQLKIHTKNNLWMIDNTFVEVEEIT